MQERTFLIQPSQAAEGFITLGEEDSHHLVRVLRTEVGDAVTCKVPGEKVFACTLVEAGKKNCRLKVEEEWKVLPKSGPKVRLLLSVPRPAVLDSLIPKVTELGLDSLQLVITERSHLKNKSEIRPARFEKLIIESMKQCGRDDLLVLEPVQTFPDLLVSLDAGEWNQSQKVLAWEEEVGGKSLRKLSLDPDRDKLFFIGPEGGIAETEARALVERGFESVRLTPNVLKVETAVLYALCHLLPGE